MKEKWNFIVALLFLAISVFFASPVQARPDVLCIYYPEWHVYPEGEMIFGKGRSEWDLVNTAKPRFPGHDQPVQLLDGCPDDSDPAAVAKEIDYAADSGIDVFVYDWYWADGHPIQHEALERGFMKAPNRSRMKFALMWANHDRSDAFRPALGHSADKYWWKLKWTSEEFLEAMDYCIRTYFASPEYYRKDGKVFFSVYSAMRLIDRVGGPEKMKATLAAAQEKMKAAGLPPIHFSAMVHNVKDLPKAKAAGYDSASSYNVTPYDFDDNDVGREVGRGKKQVLTHEEFAQCHRQYNTRIAKASELPYIPTATRGWDCTPRCRQDEPFPWASLSYPYLGVVSGLKPEIFRGILEDVRRQAENDPLKPGAILINAWNEYTEGCYLMPDKTSGRKYLDAVKAVFGTGTNTSAHLVSPVPSKAMKFASPAQVTIDDGFWKPRYELWRKVTIPDILDKDEKRGHMMENFDLAAKGAKAGWKGAAYYDGLVCEAIRGAADYLLRVPDDALAKRLCVLADRIAAAQMPDGYLHTKVQVKGMKYQWGAGGSCALSLHEIYNAGCLVEAGVHLYRATGNTKLLGCGIRFANRLCDTIGPPPKRNMIPTHSLAEEALVELAALVRSDPKAAAAGGAKARPDDYLALVGYWYSNHGNNCGEPDWEKLGIRGGMDYVSHVSGLPHPPEWRPCWGDYQMDKKPLDDYASIEGHAVRATLMCAGLAAYAAETGDRRCFALASRFWDAFVGRKYYISGGAGTDPDPKLALENFAADYVLPPDAYLETCAALGGAFFSTRMAAITGDGKYMDEVERVACNAMLAEVSKDGTRYTYQNPLNTEKGVRWEWHVVPCCPPMFLKFSGALPGFAYSSDSTGCRVNLFMGGNATLDCPVGRVRLEQRTNYPQQGHVEIAVRPVKPMAFTLKIRIPGWARGIENPFGLYTSDHSGRWSIAVDGQIVEKPLLRKGYAEIARTWNDGDRVRLELDMSPRKIRADSRVKELEGLFAEMRGPVLYAEEKGEIIPFSEVANREPCPHRVWRKAQ